MFFCLKVLNRIICTTRIMYSTYDALYWYVSYIYINMLYMYISMWLYNSTVYPMVPDCKNVHRASRHNLVRIEGPFKLLDSVAPWCSRGFRGEGGTVMPRNANLSDNCTLDCCRFFVWPWIIDYPLLLNQEPYINLWEAVINLWINLFIYK